jgi:hypothetical protein
MHVLCSGSAFVGALDDSSLPADHDGWGEAVVVAV